MKEKLSNDIKRNTYRYLRHHNEVPTCHLLKRLSTSQEKVFDVYKCAYK